MARDRCKKTSAACFAFGFCLPFPVFNQSNGNGWLLFSLLLWPAVTLWSIFQYSLDLQSINESYLRAKSIVTPLENDHVRFSWMVSIAVLLSGWIWWQIRNSKKFMSWCLFVIATWLVIFLHILAARTGLLSFYIILFVGICGLLVSEKGFYKVVRC